VLSETKKWILTHTNVCHVRCVPKDVQERHVWPNVFFAGRQMYFCMFVFCCCSRLLVVAVGFCSVKLRTGPYWPVTCTAELLSLTLYWDKEHHLAIALSPTGGQLNVASDKGGCVVPVPKSIGRPINHVKNLGSCHRPD
jgi:hypothetical protein